MDGVYSEKKERLIVTDLEHKRTVMIRPSVKERAAAAALREMKNLHNVEEVVADMAGGLDRVQKEVVPKAIRTKDRYHVQRLANAAVDVVRRAVTPGKKGRKKGQSVMCKSHIFRKRRFQLKDHEEGQLDWCLALYPELGLTYELAQAHCEFWNSPDEKTARGRQADWLELHKAWKKKMPSDLRGAFDPLIRLMENWEEGIFNYFRARHTNGFTESANAKVKRYTKRAPRAALRTVNAKIVHGSDLERQREAVRKKGKGQKGARRTQESKTTTPATTADTEREEAPLMNDSQVSPPEPNTVPQVEMGPRLDLARIASRKKGSSEDQDTAIPLLGQLPLFA